MERTYPKYAITAVGAVLIRGDEILLVKRGYPPGKGKWSIPGGVVEAGESLIEAAKRELLEETGLEAEPIGIIWVLNNIVKDREGRVKYHYVIIDVLFDSNTIKGDLKPGSDAVEASWFKIRDLRENPEVSRTVKLLIDRIQVYGLTYIPITNTENIVVE